MSGWLDGWWLDGCRDVIHHVGKAMRMQFLRSVFKR